MSEMPVVFTVVEEDSAGARAAADRYFDELSVRFDEGFDPSAYRAAAAASSPGSVVLGERDGQVVACGTLVALDRDTAELKRMWIDPGARGQGLGRRLLDQLEQLAAERGHARIRLDTNRSLTEAVAMYRRCGYRAIPRYNDNPYAHFWFEKRLRN